MAQLEGYYFSAALSCTFLVSCLLFSAFSRALREPYMDEIFHLPQAQRYCEGRFSLSQWDPMITTLPGLYLVSVGVVKPASWLLGWSEHVICSIGVLRFVNLLFSVGNFYLLYLLFRKVQPRNKSRSIEKLRHFNTSTLERLKSWTSAIRKRFRSWVWTFPLILPRADLQTPGESHSCYLFSELTTSLQLLHNINCPRAMERDMVLSNSSRVCLHAAMPPAMMMRN